MKYQAVYGFESTNAMCWHQPGITLWLMLIVSSRSSKRRQSSSCLSGRLYMLIRFMTESRADDFVIVLSVERQAPV